jgi:hypothetical protein
MSGPASAGKDFNDKVIQDEFIGYDSEGAFIRVENRPKPGSK